MHFEFLLEEPSAEAFLGRLLPHILGPHGAPHTWQLHPHQGKDDLLRKLPSRLRGYSHWLTSDQAIVVLVDNDDGDCVALRNDIVSTAELCGIGHSFLARIAVQELEAWYFGDLAALTEVYPRLPDTLARKAPYRDPDAIRGGTWERLDAELRKAGYKGGLAKVHAAGEIAKHMDPEANTSHSFRVFRDGIRELAQP